MKKLQLLRLTGLNLIGFGIGLLIAMSNYLGVCEWFGRYPCEEGYIEIGGLIDACSIILFVTFALLYFLPELTFKVWKRFMYVFGPLAIWWIAVTDSHGGFLAPDREGITLFLMAVYGIAFGIILITTLIVTFLRRRHSKQL